MRQSVVALSGVVLVAALAVVAWHHHRPREHATGRPERSAAAAVETTARADAQPHGRPADPAERNEGESELRPGLMAVYRSLTADANAVPLVRIDPHPAFTLGDSSPHPRIAPGPFELIWTGLFDAADKDDVRFSAYVGGEMSMQIDGRAVLAGRGEIATSRIESDAEWACEPGLHDLRIEYRAHAGVPARLQVWWQGATFSREPLPVWRLKHDPRRLPESAEQEPMREAGRRAAGRFGCARCHREAFPGVADPPPGPSLAALADRVDRTWLLEWLADPAKLHAGARMPVLFADDRGGFVERWAVAEYLLQGQAGGASRGDDGPADHRHGKQVFLGTGCVACHQVPDMETARQDDPDRYPLDLMHARTTPAYIADFIRNPTTRYPDGRMPTLPMDEKTARDIAGYLLMWSKPAPLELAAHAAATSDELDELAARAGVPSADRTTSAVGAAVVRDKGCANCHSGLTEQPRASVAIAPAEPRGCLSSKGLPRFQLTEESRQAIAAYLAVAAHDKHASAFEERQDRLRRFGCFRCHRRHAEPAAPLEEIGRTLWAPFMARLPYQRTPALFHPTLKHTREYLLSAVRDGVSGVRPDWYSYRMPRFGEHAAEIVRALAEADGDPLTDGDPPAAEPADPTLAGQGPSLVGFTGYSCVSCHAWNQQSRIEVEPGSIGPELTTATQRIRREWFDRWLEGPARSHPGTAMPSIFRTGQPALVRSILDGDAARQRDAIWAYLALGKDAPSPQPRPALPVPLPGDDGSLLVAQIPIQVPGGTFIEGICVLFPSYELLVYDLGSSRLHGVYTGAQILRHSEGRRSYAVAGTPFAAEKFVNATIVLAAADHHQTPSTVQFTGYDRCSDGLRIRSRRQFEAGAVDTSESFRLREEGDRRWLEREIQTTAAPVGSSLEYATAGTTKHAAGTTTLRIEVPPPQPPAQNKEAGASEYRLATIVQPEPTDGSLERPGYRAIPYPRPRTASREDRLMPSSLAVDPRTGRLYVASLKLGELLVLNDPADDGVHAAFDDFAHGLFQDAYGMLHDGDALYVLHRRNLTRIRDTDSDGVADQFDRVAAFPHAVANEYDWGYGLVRDRSGAFLLGFAPHANHHLPGAGGVVRVTPSAHGAALEEVAYGLRNPFGWCSGPEGELFLTDNQGEWVATNKLCHVTEGRFYGYPNRTQPEHTTKPASKTAVWVPYGWARSINGVAYDHTDGKFGPFAGQIFMAELMHGGGIIRANLERVNGEFQGACFPFWGNGLLGPLVLAFDPKGRLFVGSITEPGWMRQPDRGALFRIDFTGDVPFEIQSIHARPQGFRLLFTRPVNAETARDPASYQVEHYRYEYTAAYGSPELERTRVAIERIDVRSDRRAVDLITSSLVKDRVYAISAGGIRSEADEPLVHATGVYTLNEVPVR